MSFIVAGTGHRPDKLGGYGYYNPTRDRIKKALQLRLVELRFEHPDIEVVSGMALGFDQWLAEVALSLGIPVIAAVPFAGQETRWPPDSQEVYRSLLARCARVHIVCQGGYASFKMQLRNRYMVDTCNLLLAAWDGSLGGTANCIRYAMKRKRAMENIFDHPVFRKGR